MSEQEDKKEAGEDKDDVIRHNQAELFAENVSLKAERDALIKKLTEVTADLNDARSQLEAQARGKKIERIQRISKLGIEFLSEKSLAELDEIEEICKSSTMTFKSSGDATKGKYTDSLDEAHEKLRTMYKYG